MKYNNILFWWIDGYFVFKDVNDNDLDCITEQLKAEELLKIENR